jgi:hypothetical protein
MNVCRYIITLPLAVSGCAATRPIPPTGMPGSEIAGRVATTAASTGLVWPVAVGALVAILAGIATWFFGSRAAGLGMIVIGALMGAAQAWLLEVLDKLVVPSAWILGIAGLMGLAYLGGILWQKYALRKRLRERGAYIESNVDEKDLTPSAVKKVLAHVTDRKFNPEQEVTG